MHAESPPMFSKTLPFLRHVLGGGVTQGLKGLGLCRGPRQDLPGAVALQRALG